MDNPSTVCHGDITVTGHKMGFFMLFFSSFPSACKQRLIFPVLQVSPFVSFQHFVGFCPCFLLLLVQQRPHDFIQQCLCHIISETVNCLDFAIILFWIHTEGKVGGQGPWRCGPCQEISVFPFYLKPDNSGTLFYSFIALRHFLGRKWSPTPWAVWNNFKSFVQ